MKLEELMNFVCDDTEINLTDDENNIIPVNDKDGIPPFLFDSIVTDLHATATRGLVIGIDYNDFTRVTNYIRDRLCALDEDLSDTYRCDNIEQAKEITINALLDLRDDLLVVMNNINNGKAWDAGLDY